MMEEPEADAAGSTSMFVHEREGVASAASTTTAKAISMRILSFNQVVTRTAPQKRDIVTIRTSTKQRNTTTLLLLQAAYHQVSRLLALRATAQMGKLMRVASHKKEKSKSVEKYTF